MRFLPLVAPAIAVVMLAGCNSSQQTGPVVDQHEDPRQLRPAAQQGAASPAGSGCGAAIARYRSVMENDLKTGHVNQSVYNQIQGEISEADTACAAGQDGRALSLVRTSKSRHGYPG